MKVCLFTSVLVILYCIFSPPADGIYKTTRSPEPVNYGPVKKGLFDSEEIFEITLKGRVRDLFNDRSKKSQFYPLELSFLNEDSNRVAIPILIKTRGHFRKLKENCNYPPLLINFPSKKKQEPSIFSQQSKLKLVMPCKDDEYIIREWLVYRLYNLITEKSFRARLVRVKLVDETSKKTPSSFFGILLEEEQQLAKRTKMVSVTRKIKPEQTQQDEFQTIAVFQYLIGNTDWSIQYMQNIKFLAANSNAVATAVPYDFDHSGLVGAPYAQPADALKMSSVRERRYRGYCVEDIKVFDDVLARYNNLKKEIYLLYGSCNLLSEKYLKNTIKYFDEFYKTINNPAALKKEFLYPCMKSGTGNVVIKGLRED